MQGPTRVLAAAALAAALACGCSDYNLGGNGGNGDGNSSDGSGRNDAGVVNPDDTDGDGIANEDDNCPDVSNADQDDFDDDGLGDPCDPDPPPETCGDARVDAERIAPNVLVVLDRSLSMDQQNKWDDATAALTSLSSSLADQLRLGLALFPGGDGGGGGWGGGARCEAPERILPVGDNSATAFQASYADERPSGYTPMRLALQVPRTEGWLDDASDPDDDRRSKNVLLVTDGQPNCAEGHESDYNYSDLDATLAEAKLLRDSGAYIYVVGFGDGVDADALNQLADTGGTDNPADPSNRYFQAQNGAQLEAALLAIGAQIGSCTLELDGRPAAPTKIYVLLGDEPIVRDDADGFSYDGATNTIELQGAACDTVKGPAPPSITVIFGCPADGSPPVIK